VTRKQFRIRKQRVWSTALNCFVVLRNWTKRDAADFVACLDEECNVTPLNKDQIRQMREARHVTAR